MWEKFPSGGPHTVPAQKTNISKKIIAGKSLTFSFMQIIRRFLLFARLSYYFTPYNRLTDYSLQVHKLKKSSTLLSFWPAGFIPPPNDWKLTDAFFPISILWARCENCLLNTALNAARRNLWGTALLYLPIVSFHKKDDMREGWKLGRGRSSSWCPRPSSSQCFGPTFLVDRVARTAPH